MSAGWWSGAGRLWLALLAAPVASVVQLRARSLLAAPVVAHDVALAAHPVVATPVTRAALPGLLPSLGLSPAEQAQVAREIAALGPAASAARVLQGAAPLAAALCHGEVPVWFSAAPHMLVRGSGPGPFPDIAPGRGEGAVDATAARLLARAWASGEGSPDTAFLALAAVRLGRLPDALGVVEGPWAMPPAAGAAAIRRQVPGVGAAVAEYVARVAWLADAVGADPARWGCAGEAR